MSKETCISPSGDKWSAFKQTLLTPEERNEIDIKVQIVTEILNARHEQGLTQKAIEKASGVKQPIIARMERGTNDPQLTTVIKVLAALGKTLAVVPIESKKHHTKA